MTQVNKITLVRGYVSFKQNQQTKQHQLTVYSLYLSGDRAYDGTIQVTWIVGPFSHKTFIMSTDKEENTYTIGLRDKLKGASIPVLRPVDLSNQDRNR